MDTPRCPVEGVYDYLPLARCMDPELAMDILHRAAVYMLENPAKLHSNFPAWCFWTIRNQRAFLQRERRYVGFVEWEHSCSQPAYDDRAAWVERHLSKLSKVGSRLIALILSGKDDTELRGILHLSRMALKNLKYRAIQDLRGMVEDE